MTPKQLVTIEELSGQPKGSFERFTKAQKKRDRKAQAKILQRVRSKRGQRR